VTPLQERQIEFCGYFLKAGYPPKSAAAIGGNATRENLCLPTTIGAKDHGSDGVLQWRKERLIELQAMTDWQTLKTQAAFTILELQRDYKVLESDLRAGVKTLATLTLDFCDVFERPSADGRVADRRIGAASDCMNLIVPVAMPAEPLPPLVVPRIPPLPNIPTSYLPPLKGTEPMPPFDPILAAQLVSVFAPLVETLISGLIKEIVLHAGQPGGLPKLPIPIGQLPIDPAVIEKLVMDVLARQAAPK
jgi:Phage tail lysozyme